MTNAHVLPPGELNLVKALTSAAKARGARYVHHYAGLPGWYTSDVIPRGVPSYFRVSGQRIWIRTADKAEILVATVVAGKIVPEQSAAKFFAS